MFGFKKAAHNTMSEAIQGFVLTALEKVNLDGDGIPDIDEAKEFAQKTGDGCAAVVHGVDIEQVIVRGNAAWVKVQELGAELSGISGAFDQEKTKEAFDHFKAAGDQLSQYIKDVTAHAQEKQAKS